MYLSKFKLECVRESKMVGDVEGYIAICGEFAVRSAGSFYMFPHPPRKFDPFHSTTVYKSSIKFHGVRSLRS